MVLKYIGRYLQESVCKKVLLKNTLYFGKYKKDKFLVVNSSKVVVKNIYFLSKFCIFVFPKI
jgi:hypothetical protein